MKFYIGIVALLVIFTGYGWQLFNTDPIESANQASIHLEQGSYLSYLWYSITSYLGSVGSIKLDHETSVAWLIWRLSGLTEYILLYASIIAISLKPKLLKLKVGLSIMALCQLVILSSDFIQTIFTYNNSRSAWLEISTLVVFAITALITTDVVKIKSKLIDSVKDQYVLLVGTGIGGKKYFNQLQDQVAQLENELLQQQLHNQSNQILNEAISDDLEHTIKKTELASGNVDAYLKQIKLCIDLYNKTGLDKALDNASQFVDLSLKYNSFKPSNS